MRTYKFTIPLFYVALLAGCANLAPDYARPELPVPTSLDKSSASAAQPTAKLDWQEVVTDARLKKTVELALVNNRDLRIAALNIERARAQYGIRRADLFPSVSAGGGQSAQRVQSGPRDTSVSTARPLMTVSSTCGTRHTLRQSPS